MSRVFPLPHLCDAAKSWERIHFRSDILSGLIVLPLCRKAENRLAECKERKRGIHIGMGRVVRFLTGRMCNRRPIGSWLMPFRRAWRGEATLGIASNNKQKQQKEKQGTR